VRGLVLTLGVPRVELRGIREESCNSILINSILSILKYYIKGGVILLYKLIIIIK
jgi:hypothetical protein